MPLRTSGCPYSRNLAPSPNVSSLNAFILLYSIAGTTTWPSVRASFRHLYLLMFILFRVLWGSFIFTAASSCSTYTPTSRCLCQPEVEGGSWGSPVSRRSDRKKASARAASAASLVLIIELFCSGLSCSQLYTQSVRTGRPTDRREAAKASALQIPDILRCTYTPECPVLGIKREGRQFGGHCTRHLDKA